MAQSCTLKIFAGGPRPRLRLRCASFAVARRVAELLAEAELIRLTAAFAAFRERIASRGLLTPAASRRISRLVGRLRYRWRGARLVLSTSVPHLEFELS